VEAFTWTIPRGIKNRNYFAKKQLLWPSTTIHYYYQHHQSVPNGVPNGVNKHSRLFSSTNVDNNNNNNKSQQDLSTNECEQQTVNITTQQSSLGHKVSVHQQQQIHEENNHHQIIMISQPDDVRNMDPKDLLATWRDLPVVNPTLCFDTLLVPASCLQTYVQHPSLQHLLAKPSNWDMLQNVHPRIKMVQDYNETFKLLLLLPKDKIIKDHDHDSALQQLLESSNRKDDDAFFQIQRGPPLSMQLSYRQLSFPYILQQLLPWSLLPPPSAYEQIGRIAHFNLKACYQNNEYRHLIGQVLVATTPGIDTVIQKVGQVSGKYRTYQCEILATSSSIENNNIENNNNIEKYNNGDDDNDTSNPAASLLLHTTVMEDGIHITFNVAECYWCTRLSGERQQLVQDIIRSATATTATTKSWQQQQQQQLPLVVADVFCGVGAACLLLAKKRQQQQQPKLGNTHNQKLKKKNNKKKNDDNTNNVVDNHTSLLRQPPATPPPITKIIANDWNPKAIEYFGRAIPANNLDESQFELSCLDAYDFLMDLGADPLMINGMDIKVDSDHYDGDDMDVTSAYTTTTATPLLPHHILMNFPLEAPKFLGALRWWSWERVERQHAQEKEQCGTGRYPRFHVYTFARATQIGLDDEEEVAVDIVANELLPAIGSGKNDNDDENDVPYDNDNAVVVAQHRRNELNDEFDAQVSTRLVRDVAPGKVVVCVSFSLTPKLIRYMQGEYF
jgi:tRNA G37 N-methylase Trm5